MGVNDPIPYGWTFGWDPEMMSEPTPKVNLLLKALVEHDYQAMDELYRRGARLGDADDETLGRVLYHVAGDYKTISWLVDHGLYGRVNYSKDGADGRRCWGPDGYGWGLLARAWYLESYDTMELLAVRAFDDMGICVGGEGCDLIDIVFASDDVTTMRILREHSYPTEMSNFIYAHAWKKYPNSKVFQDGYKNPFIRRKSFGLGTVGLTRRDHFTPIPELDEYERSNETTVADHADKVRAQREYAAKYAKNGRVRTQEEQKHKDDEDDALDHILFESLKDWHSE